MVIQFGVKEHIKMAETYQWAEEELTKQRKWELELLEDSRRYWQGETADAFRQEHEFMLMEGEYAAYMRHVHGMKEVMEDSIPRFRRLQQMVAEFPTAYGLPCDDEAPETLRLDEEALAEFHEMTDEILRKNRYVCEELGRIMDGCNGLVDFSAERRELEELREDMRQMEVFKQKVEEYADEMRHMDNWMVERLSEFTQIGDGEKSTISGNDLSNAPEDFGLERGGEILKDYLQSVVNENGEYIYADNVDEIIAEIKIYCPWALTSLYATASYDTSGYDSALERASRIANIAAQGRLARASKFLLHIETYVSNLAMATNENLGKDNISVEMLQYFARELMWEGYEPAFVAGLLGNMLYESSFGGLESSAYSLPETKPPYLQYMDELGYMEHEFSGNNIMNLGISAVESLLNRVILHNNENPDEEAKFGIGSIQWTEPDRVAVLLSCYKEVCGENDKPTEEQCMEAECNCLIGELNGDYDALYHTRYGNIYSDWIEKSGENIDMQDVRCATEKLFYKYINPGTNTLEDRVNAAEKIYEIMMGEL